MTVYRFVCSIALLFVLTFTAAAKDPKLTAEEVIQKSLAAIGTPEARAAESARRLVGNVELKQFEGLGHTELGGPVSLMTIAPDRTRLQMKFYATSYQQEDFVFDKDKVNIAFTSASGGRSRLGDFLMKHEAILREGLLGGPLSAADPLANPARQAKVTYDGLKKVDNAQLHQLSYYPKKNSDGLLIKLFFEPETFRHVMTRYTWTKQLGFDSDPTVTAKAQTLHYEIIENFSDFKQMSGLTLPVDYTIRFYTDDVVVGYYYKMRFDHYNKAEIPGVVPISVAPPQIAH